MLNRFMGKPNTITESQFYRSFLIGIDFAKQITNLPIPNLNTQFNLGVRNNGMTYSRQSKINLDRKPKL